MGNIDKFELKRQAFHILLGMAIVVLLLYGFIGFDFELSGITIPFADILLLIIFGLSLSYFSRSVNIPMVSWLLKKFERQNEIKKFPGRGLIFYLVGVYISLLLFPKDIALASVLVLALGDSVSHLFGLHYGKIKNPLSKTKFLEGTAAGLLAGFIGALVFLPWHEAFLASFAAMVIEAIEIKLGTEQVDDNLLIPVVAGAAVFIIRLF